MLKLFISFSLPPHLFPLILQIKFLEEIILSKKKKREINNELTNKQICINYMYKKKLRCFWSFSWNYSHSYFLEEFTFLFLFLNQWTSKWTNIWICSIMIEQKYLILLKSYRSHIHNIIDGIKVVDEMADWVDCNVSSSSFVAWLYRIPISFLLKREL